MNGLILEPSAISDVLSSSTDTGYRASNVGNDAMGLVWKSETGSTTQWISFDLGADTAFDTLVLLGLDGAQSAWQWSIDIATSAQGRFTGSYWSGTAEDLLAGSVMPVSGKGKAIWQAPAGAPASGRYVRINFSALSNAAVTASRVIVSQAISLARNFSYGAAFGIRPLGSLDFSARGVVLRRRGKKLRGVGISYDAATKAEIETYAMPLLERVGNDNPICIVTDPEADDQRQNRIYYGFLTGDLGSIWARVGGFTVSFNLVALD